MNRNIKHLSRKNYDLLIIGGGIVGASAAFDASLRGLSVCLVDKADFGGATSASSGKMIHGGIRFMQHAKFLRVRESLHYRSVFLNIAPHLVHPVPFIIPTYGHGMKGKEILTAGMIVYEILGLDKNRTSDKSKRIPKFKVLSKEETLKLEPDINSEGLTGSVLYYDCQMHTPERLTLAFIRSAYENGADVFNYIQIESLITRNDKVIGAHAKDLLNDEKFLINSRFVINASGPWINKILENSGRKSNYQKFNFSKGIHLITKPLTNNYAIALATKHKQAKSLVSRGGRHFFIAPWKNHSLIGTTNVDFHGDQDDKMVSRKDIEDFLDEIKDSFKPASKLTLNDIKYFYGGLYIDDAEIKLDEGYQGHRNDQIFDHKKNDDLNGLISVIGVKYTTSPHLAKKIIDIVIKRLNKGKKISGFERSSVYGGDIEDYDEFVNNAVSKYAGVIDKDVIENLILLYGTKYADILDLGSSDGSLLERIDNDLPYIKAQVVYAVEHEMAVKLTDVFLRRIGNGTLKRPDMNEIECVANLMASKLNWNEERIRSEINELNSVYSLN